MSGSENYYQILGVEADVSLEAIKKSYRKLAMQYHPDKVTADVSEKVGKCIYTPEAAQKILDETEAKFKEIVKAHEILSDEVERAAYDDFLKKGGGDHYASAQREEKTEDSGMSAIRKKWYEAFEERNNTLKRLIDEGKPEELAELWEKSDRSPYTLRLILDSILSPSHNNGDLFGGIISRLVIDKKFLDHDLKETINIYYLSSEGVDCYLHQALKRGFQDLTCSILKFAREEAIHEIGYSNQHSTHSYHTLIEDKERNNTLALAYLHRREKVVALYHLWIKNLIDYNDHCFGRQNTHLIDFLTASLNKQQQGSRTLLHIAMDEKYPWPHIEDLVRFYSNPKIQDERGRDGLDRFYESLMGDHKGQDRMLSHLILQKEGDDANNRNAVASLSRLRVSTLEIYAKIEKEMHEDDFNFVNALSLLSSMTSMLAMVKTGNIDKVKFEECATKLRTMMTSWDWRVVIGCFVGACIGVLAVTAINPGLSAGMLAGAYVASVITGSAIGGSIGFWRTKENDPVRKVEAATRQVLIV